MRRVTGDIPDERFEELMEMQRIPKIKTAEEFTNMAFGLLKWAVEERQAGRGIASIDEVSGKYSELSNPYLDQIEKKE